MSVDLEVKIKELESMSARGQALMSQVLADYHDQLRPLYRLRFRSDFAAEVVTLSQEQLNRRVRYIYDVFHRWNGCRGHSSIDLLVRTILRGLRFCSSTATSSRITGA